MPLPKLKNSLTLKLALDSVLQIRELVFQLCQLHPKIYPKLSVKLAQSGHNLAPSVKLGIQLQNKLMSLYANVKLLELQCKLRSLRKYKLILHQLNHFVSLCELEHCFLLLKYHGQSSYRKVGPRGIRIQFFGGNCDHVICQKVLLSRLKVFILLKTIFEILPFKTQSTSLIQGYPQN